MFFPCLLLLPLLLFQNYYLVFRSAIDFKFSFYVSVLVHRHWFLIFSLLFPESSVLLRFSVCFYPVRWLYFTVLSFLVISCLSLVPSLFKFCASISFCLLSVYFKFSLYSSKTPRSFNFLSTPAFIPFAVFKNYFLSFLTDLVLKIFFLRLRFRSLSLRFSFSLSFPDPPRCLHFLSMPTFIPFAVFFRIIPGVSVVPSLFKFSFCISVIAGCPYVLIFSFFSLIPLTFKIFLLCRLLLPLLFFLELFLVFP